MAFVAANLRHHANLFRHDLVHSHHSREFDQLERHLPPMAAWQRHSSDLIAFPTPWRSTDVVYPGLFPNIHSGLPFALDKPQNNDPDDWKGMQIFKTLRDKSLADHAGDLGWSLDYATAWCYKNLLDNRLDIVDVVDTVRQACPQSEDVDPLTPFYIFDSLDRALFGNKLRSMVFLTWIRLPSCSSGTTSAPGVIGSRITIQLNIMPFQEDDADIDDLLEALIHHMIHAFFLVCCGAQKKGDKQDGRLLDGLHFGVVLLTIKDITEDCDDGSLPFIFHASKRRQAEGQASFMQSMTPLGLMDARDPYISMDPRGRAVIPPCIDGQTHCLHDNRNISQYHLKNWQVQDFARAWDMDMESKGDEIWDFDKKGVLEKNNRLKMASSATYAELIWDEKFVMISREKALAFKSLEKALRKGDFSLKIPKCEEETLKCLHDYISKREYDGSSLEDDQGLGRRLGGLRGPPIIAAQNFPRFRLNGEPKCDAITHIKVFKLARDLEFEELMAHSMRRLSTLPVTNDDPIDILHEVYDVTDNGIGAASVHPLLHKFARDFLSVTDDEAALYPADAHERHLLQRHLPPRGLSNYQKISRGRQAEFQDLLLRSPAFRDDVRLITDGRNLNVGHGLDGPAAFMAMEEAGFGVGMGVGGFHDHHRRRPLGLEWGRRDPSPLRLVEQVDRAIDGVRRQNRRGRRGGEVWEEDRVHRGRVLERVMQQI